MAPKGPSARVLIAGGGVAGLEALLALNALAAGRVDVTIVTPELRFINRSMSVDQPFKRQRGRGVRLINATAELGAHWHRGALDRVEHRRRCVVTKDGDELAYDLLVLAVGARPEHEWRSQNLLTYSGERSGPSYRLLLHQLLERRIDKVAFVRPPGASWPLPLYDLALMTAAECAAHDLHDVELSLVAPEERPLEIFGSTASVAVRTLLDEAGVTLHASSYGIIPSRAGWLDIFPGDRGKPVDRIVTEPRLLGPRLRGVPCGSDGFIHVDAYGRVAGMEDVFAAGDATDFAIKQGGLAAQQADAVAEAIAAAVGVDIDPEPFRPILRGVLLTGERPWYLRRELDGAGGGGDSIVSDEALWWPPNKLCGRYLAPYLSSQVGEAADVMPHDHYAAPEPLGRSRT